jgi:transcriptional regulator
MYVPALFAADEDAGWRIAAQHPFGLLIVPPDPVIAPVPFAVDPKARTLLAHVARDNPAADALDGKNVQVYFGGPHAYVSPTWYQRPDAQVPTWNYAAAHASGKARVLDDGELRSLLAELARIFEPAGGWDPSVLDAKFFDGLRRGIVGFAIEAPSIRAKLKLSQNRSEADRRGVMDGLSARDAPGDGALLEEMRALYEGPLRARSR